MKQAADPLQRRIETLDGISALLADTSSLIYLDRLGLLKLLGATVAISCTRAIKAEWEAKGDLLPPFIRVIDSTARFDSAPRVDSARSADSVPGVDGIDAMGKPLYPKGQATDRELVAEAIRLNSPVLSEDRRILAAVIEASLECFVALEMAALLLRRGSIDHAAYEAARDALRDFARYPKELAADVDRLVFAMDKY